MADTTDRTISSERRAQWRADALLSNSEESTRVLRLLDAYDARVRPREPSALAVALDAGREDVRAAREARAVVPPLRPDPDLMDNAEGIQRDLDASRAAAHQELRRAEALDPTLSADNGTVGTTSHTREVSLIAEALCDCSQTQGRHARSCVTIRAQNFRRLTNAIAAHDERTARDTEAFCRSCGEQLDPDNMLRLNGIPYHLGNCPRPHGDPDD